MSEAGEKEKGEHGGSLSSIHPRLHDLILQHIGAEAHATMYQGEHEEYRGDDEGRGGWETHSSKQAIHVGTLKEATRTQIQIEMPGDKNKTLPFDESYGFKIGSTQLKGTYHMRQLICGGKDLNIPEENARHWERFNGIYDEIETLLQGGLNTDDAKRRVIHLTNDLTPAELSILRVRLDYRKANRFIRNSRKLRSAEKFLREIEKRRQRMSQEQKE